MRVSAACLLGFLGLGGLAALAACSDSTDMGPAAGAGGSSGASAAGSGGKAGSAGGTSEADAGAAGASECGILKDACQACLLVDHCSEQFGECSSDTDCASALGALTNCFCDPSMDSQACQATFVTKGGAVAEKLANCFSLNCEELCK